MIPGYHCESHELNGKISHGATNLFNPYDRDSLINQIGNDIDSELENSHLADISNILNRCSYKEPSNVTNVRQDELRVLYLNVRSLTKHAEECRENFSYSQKYDVLCFNETSCDVDQLPNRIQDINICGFHEPIVQKPHRESNRAVA